MPARQQSAKENNDDHRRKDRQAPGAYRPGLFDKLTLRIMADDGLDRATAERIVEQALAFLMTCARYPDGHLSPSQTVDVGWHAFILHTSDYAEFCQRVAGRFIHHRPTGPGEAAGQQQAIGVTIAAMRNVGVLVDPDLWVPRAECSQCYQGWESLPPGRVTAIENLTGPVLKAESVTGGLMPGLAAVLHTENRRYFLKAAQADRLAARLYEREMSANAALPEGAAAPRMLFSSDAEGWLVMVFDFLDARDADLSPGSPDLTGVLAILRKIGTMPVWDAARPVTQNVAALQDKAVALLAKYPSGHPWDMYRAAIGGFDDGTLVGGSIVHYDLHPGNLKVTGNGQVLAVDWAFACSGAQWVDAALLVPRFIEAGHSPASAERLAAQIPAWRAAPPSAVTALAALWTMFREYKALHGPMDGRTFRAQAARAGRAWVSHRMS